MDNKIPAKALTRLSIFVHGMGKAILREVVEDFEALEAEVGRLKALAVMEFNEDEVPSFTQGYHPHELTTMVTADRCSGLVKMITDLRAQLAAAQGQSPVAEVESIDTSEAEGEASAWVSLYNKIDVGTKLYAAPISQQPAEPRPVYGKPGTRDVDVAEAMKRWDAAQQPAPSVPEGWQWVPIAPTREMLNAPTNAWSADAKVTYKAMLAAAPQPKGTK